MVVGGCWEIRLLAAKAAGHQRTRANQKHARESYAPTPDQPMAWHDATSRLTHRLNQGWLSTAHGLVPLDNFLQISRMA